MTSPFETDGTPHASILAAVLQESGVTHEALVGPARHYPLVQARHAAMHLLRVHLGLPLRAIGNLFHRDPSTICHALQSVRNRQETDRAFRAFYDRVQARLIAGLTGPQQAAV